MIDEDVGADWIDRSIPLDELTLETRLLRSAVPELVLDTGVEGIAQMVRAAGVSSYVVAPIMPGGRVVGFLHADHGTRAGPATGRPRRAVGVRGGVRAPIRAGLSGGGAAGPARAGPSERVVRSTPAWTGSPRTRSS